MIVRFKPFVNQYSLMSNLSGTLFPIEQSSYYQQWLAEKAAIETHKWYLSEQVGRDVGLEYAQWNWIMGGFRAKWLVSFREEKANPQ